MSIILPSAKVAAGRLVSFPKSSHVAHQHITKALSPNWDLEKEVVLTLLDLIKQLGDQVCWSAQQPA